METAREKKRAYDLANKDKRKARDLKNREHIRAYRAAQYARDKQERLARGAEYCAKHKEELRASMAKYREDNREHVKALCAAGRARNYGAQRERSWQVFGIDMANWSYEAYEKMYEAQGGTCAGCGIGIEKAGTNRITTAHVDHDHATGRVRGLLCTCCNYAIGHMKDDVQRLGQLSAYLLGAQTSFEPLVAADEEYSRQYRATREKIWKHYGMTFTFDEFLELYRAQGGCCACCGVPVSVKRVKGSPVACVDHCHTSGRVRGVLCGACNTAIGCVKESLGTISALINYLV